MDLHNMDEFLDLQDQNTTNLLSNEKIQQPEQMEEEWHSATPLDEMLSTSTDDKGKKKDKKIANNLLKLCIVPSDWSLLQNGLDTLQEMNLTEIMGHFSNTENNCITPDSLLKPQPPQPAEEEETKRVTRSGRATGKKTAEQPKTKKKTTRAKKVYCICKQPYNGKPMVQCDRCEEW